MNRHAIANNKNIDTYNQYEPNSFIINLDVNNLYGKCLNMLLPYKNFEFLNESEYNIINWAKIKTEDEKGYIIECDLLYPDDIHDKHENFPLCPSNDRVKNNELSEYQHKSIENLKNIGYKNLPTNKLLLTLKNKENYIVHFKNLKLYLKLGLKITKIHRVLSFDQFDFLKPYITMNTELRKIARTDFEKDLYKLLNNSIYGKSIEDKRKHLNIKVAINKDQCIKYAKSPLFENAQILDENISLMKLKKSCVVLDKPIYIGFTVLEYAKNYMYKLYYLVFQKHYGDKLKLLYTDTDSFIFLVYTNDIDYDWRNVFGHLMDFSNYPNDHRNYDDSNKKKIGFLKVENAEKFIKEFVGLKSKLYSILFNDETQKRTAKGLNKCVLKNNVDHFHYKNEIKLDKNYLCQMRRIQSKNHQLRTLELNKLIFTCFDDKRFICEDGTTTIPYGHYKLKN